MSLRARLFAMTYDRQMAKAEKAQLRDLRQGLLAAAAGDVIEIGAGTGANLPCYRPGVTSLTLTEPEPPMVRRLERRAREQAPLANAMSAIKLPQATRRMSNPPKPASASVNAAVPIQ